MKRQPSRKPKFNLNYVISETGINADTLRAWERRYKLPNPERTPGGHRLFSEFDIEIIKWLSRKQKEGLSISRAVELWLDSYHNGNNPLLYPGGHEHINSLDPVQEQGNENILFWRNKWVKACLDFDEHAAEQLLSQSFARFSMENVCVGILQSGLAKIGKSWFKGEVSVQQEHFASELAIRRLQSLLISSPQPHNDKTIIMGCPPGETHTFSILLLSLLLRYRGWNIIYLGADVPRVRLMETIKTTKPDLIVMTSMRLVTTATLSEFARFLIDINIPLAFGGWIFDRNPNLVQRIAGHYLGGDLFKAATKIENLLSNPIPEISTCEENNCFSEIKLQLIKNQHLIENNTLQMMRENYDHDTSSKFIETVDDYLTKDIIASLSLGDLSLLDTNLEWVENLIKNQGFSKNHFYTYLESYSESVTRYLGETGFPIRKALTSFFGK